MDTLRQWLVSYLVGQGVYRGDAEEVVCRYAQENFAWATRQEFSLDRVTTRDGAQIHIELLEKWRRGIDKTGQ